MGEIMLWRRGRQRRRDSSTVAETDQPQSPIGACGASTTRADMRATPDDVAHAYQLLLWREAESAEVIASKVGQPSDEMLRGFVASDEFGATVMSLLNVDNAWPVQGRLVPPDLLAWVIGFFSLDEVTAAAAGRARWLQSLFGVLVNQPVLHDIVDACHGAGTAERMARAAALIGWTDPALTENHLGEERATEAGTTGRDMRNLYLLLHNRPPETAAVARARPHARFLDVTLEFLTSKEFAITTVGAALDGTLRDHLPLAKELREWTNRAFDIELGEQAGRIEAIAAIVRQRAVAEPLAAAGLVWSVDTLLRALNAAASDSGRNQKLSVAAHIRDIGRGVELQEISGIGSGDRFGQVQYTNTDPWIRFRLKPEVARGDLVQLHLRASHEGQNIAGHLYLDYGAGRFTHEESLAVPLDEEGFGRVLIVKPGSVRELRWDPTHASGRGTISVIAAEPVTVEYLMQAARSHAGGEEALINALIAESARDPRTPLAGALTRVLSRQPNDYTSWLAANELRGTAGERIWREQLAALTQRCLISIIVPTYNTDEHLLREMIDSVVAQIYPDWELCIVDDASTVPHVQAVIEEYAAKDRRIRYVIREQNGHISAASNSALRMATGEWVALLDHDDLLRPNALLAIARQISAAPNATLIYSDEDKIDRNGVRFSPYFKPDFSPEMLLAHNYLNHFSVFRTESVRSVGGWREGFEGSQDFDLILRVLDANPNAEVSHIPEILYHWRAITGSTALAENEKGYAVHAGLRALRDHLDRTGTRATTGLVAGRSLYRVTPALPDPAPLVSLIMPTRDQAELVRMAARSVLDLSTYDRFELIIVDNGSQDADTFALFDELAKDSRVSILSYPYHFNYSAINNHAFRHSRGDVIGLINNDIEVISPGWLEELVGWSMKKGIGCVGAKLYYPDKTIQHAGVVVGLGGIANHIHRRASHDDPGYFARNLVHHNVSAVTGACLFVQRSIYEDIGGLDEELQVAFNDVDFCLRVRAAGYRNLFTPFAELFHHESISRGVEDTPEKIARFTAEIEFMDKRWGDELRTDPYYSPNFDLMGEDYALGVSPYRKGLV